MQDSKFSSSFSFSMNKIKVLLLLKSFIKRCDYFQWEHYKTSLFLDAFYYLELLGTLIVCLKFSSIQLFSCVQLFVTPWAASCRVFLSITTSQSLLKLMSIKLMMPSNHLILFSSCLQSFPASGSFPMSQFFPSGGQSIGVLASASVLLVNIQD